MARSTSSQRDEKKTEQRATREAALEQLAILGGGLVGDDDVAFEGRRFVLPETTNLEEAIEFLQEKLNEDERVVSFSRTFRYRPLDGARATANALRQVFGFAVGRPIVSLFSYQPPELIDVLVDLETYEQVPWGRMGIPGLEDANLYLGEKASREFGPLFHIEVTAKRKHRHHIEGLFGLIEFELKENSIYRGKAINGQDRPEFIDLSGVNPTNVVFAEDVGVQLEANVWSPIRHAEVLEKLGQPGKRAVLFEGPYGSGKTLAAYLTAQTAVEHGWTFVYCRPGQDSFDRVMQTARLYQPSVVFYEDVDNIAEVGGSTQISRMLDLFDGITAKGTKMLMVLTTNHVEQIHKGMVRPGRLDAVIHIAEMDRAGIEQLVKATISTESLSPDVDYDRVYQAMKRYMPAFVKEAIDRTVRYSVSRNDGVLGAIETEDLVQAANGLTQQLLLMESASDRKSTPTLDVALGETMQAAVYHTINEAQIVRVSQGDEWARIMPNGERV